MRKHRSLRLPHPRDQRHTSQLPPSSTVHNHLAIIFLHTCSAISFSRVLVKIFPTKTFLLATCHSFHNVDKLFSLARISSAHHRKKKKSSRDPDCRTSSPPHRLPRTSAARLRQSPRRLRPQRTSPLRRHRSHLGVRLRPRDRHPAKGPCPHPALAFLV